MKKILLLIAAALLMGVPATKAQNDDAQSPRQQQRSERGAHQQAQQRRGQHPNPANFRVAGVWQQVQAFTDSTGQMQDLYLPVWKVLQGDGHFTNFVMAYNKAPAFITHEGSFRVVSDKYYSERTRQSVVSPEMAGVEVMMEYTFNQDKDEMTLRFMLPNSEKPQTERWRRVRLEVPQQLRQ